jgi:hypothetical protein
VSRHSTTGGDGDTADMPTPCSPSARGFISGGEGAGRDVCQQDEPAALTTEGHPGRAGEGGAEAGRGGQVKFRIFGDEYLALSPGEFLAEAATAKGQHG